MNTVEALQSLGLNEKEARVYLALLALGRSSAYGVAERSGLKKPTTYVILGELMKKGLVNKIPRTRKQLFVAKSPDEYFALAEERLSFAKKVLPELMALGEGMRPKVRTMYYEGLRGVQEALWHRSKEMNGRELVGFYATDVDAAPTLMNVFREWNDLMKKNRISMRLIVPEHPSLEKWRKTDAMYDRTVKIVPFEEYSANISIDVGDTFVRILAFRELQAVVIENPDVAKTVRQIFEMLWKVLPRKKS